MESAIVILMLARVKASLAAVEDGDLAHTGGESTLHAALIRERGDGIARASGFFSMPMKTSTGIHQPRVDGLGADK